MTKIAIMQPYFLPYIPYWSLIESAEIFVVYDNIQYTKKGWINRNRFLQNGKAGLFSLPLKKDSDYKDIKDRIIASSFSRIKLLNRIKNSYQKAPYFNEVYLIVESIIMDDRTNLFDYILNSIQVVCRYLEISTNIIISSNLNIDHSLKSQDKVLAICKELNARTYINATGGQNLYTIDVFKKCNVDIKFIQSNSTEYKQFNNQFLPNLSILDVIMFNSKDEINLKIKEYKLI